MFTFEHRRTRMITDFQLLSEQQICDQEAAVQFMCAYLSDADQEEVIVVPLDTKNRPICFYNGSIGSLNESMVHPRDLIKGLFLCNANSFLLFHNHPSGVVCPSKADEDLTKRINEIADLIGIRMLDHIIIGRDGTYYSFLCEKEYQRRKQAESAAEN